MLTLFKPNSKGTGSALTISFNSKDDKKGVFLEFIKQTGWNEQTKKGSFKGGVKITTKLSTTEASQIISNLERNTVFLKPFYHNSPNGGSTIINLSEFKGMPVLSIKKGEDKAGIALSEGETVEVREFLKFALAHIFSGLYSAHLKRAKEYAEGNGGDKENSEQEYSPRAKKSVRDFVEQKPSTQSADVGEIEDDEIPF